MPTARVFVSYSSKDEKEVNPIVDYLEKNQINCFIAPRDIPFGSDYSETLIKAIEECNYFILVLTKNSNESGHVRNEVDRAFNKKKRIIVFRIENISLSKSLEYYTSTFQWLDAFENSQKVYYNQLYCFLNGLPLPPLSKKLLLSKKIVLNFLLFYLLGTILLFCLFGIPILEDYRYISQKTLSGERLIDEISLSGLSGIERKNTDKNPVPKLYENSRYEIFISGVTLRTTLEAHRDFLQNAVKRGVKIKLLLLNPKSSDSIVFEKDDQSWTPAIQSSLDIIKKAKLFKDANVEIRFANKLPPLIGIMIDGSIDSHDKNLPKSGAIRVLPYFRSKQHDDWAILFKKDSITQNAYEDFASEFRYYWNLAERHNELFE